MQPDEWVVADGGQVKASLTMGQTHSWYPSPSGPINFINNLQAAIQLVTGDIVIFMEDDDWYDARHIETLVGQLARPDVVAAGDDRQRYYNLEFRCWRTFTNTGASLCQTGLRRSELFAFERILQRCAAKQTYGADTWYWQCVIQTGDFNLQRADTVVGIKGLPGQIGLGVGHRPRSGWAHDSDGSVLRQFIGADADVYAPFAGVVESADRPAHTQETLAR